MNVVIVCDYLGNISNGTTVAADNLIRSLRDKGHQVRVLCCDQNYVGQQDYYVVPAINFYFLNGYVQKNEMQLAVADRKTIEKVLLGADVVHIVMPFLLASVTAKMAKQKGIPVTASFHCQAENVTSHFFLKNSYFASKVTYQMLEKYVYQYADAIHYPTEFIMNVFAPYTKNQNPWVISNGVNARFIRKDVERDPKYDDKFVIVFSGRYSKEKCHSVLIDAVNQSRFRDQIQLIFPGTGPLKETLVKYARCLPNAPVFQYFSRNEMVTILNSADLYVHPADIELEGISCLEAISCGLTPIFSDSPRSATRLLARTEQNIFHMNDSTDLSKKIDWWIEHPSERKRCGEAYSKTAKEQYDFSLCMDKMEKMLLSVAKVR